MAIIIFRKSIAEVRIKKLKSCCNYRKLEDVLTVVTTAIPKVLEEKAIDISQT
ncbi:hypothetical protein [Okeania sp.]|uniref:hypothetical protein n=1 Tax=Okeania sp. TaxID=3100323 RepID=UPI002B4AF456|nr:hypothetical protein [Okeania sp.]MEB3342365.1 hypothetical protein [Okeania sp.]